MVFDVIFRGFFDMVFDGNAGLRGTQPGRRGYERATQRTVKPFVLLLLFAGLTLVVLKFKL